ncbi:hypothetical protein [Kutzneria sp. 744]|uniref:hypothetical protein n=1 Tax=Kutzneria sp. (strain 744) TaxID=345341 RepID=UPI0003EEDFB3|nr:hypothetical protein [Kutzneria sp. 744]EWM19625.1 hypothetical protein KUTG_09929 [Kutzneria sp. 744]
MTSIDTPLSRELAEAAFTACKTQFADWLEPWELAGQQEPPLCGSPELIERFNGKLHWAIVWRDGPQGWEQHAFQGWLDVPAYKRLRLDGETPKDAAQKASRNSTPVPPGVFPEPITNGALGLYPAVTW